MKKPLARLLLATLCLSPWSQSPAQSWTQTLGTASKPTEAAQQADRPLIGVYFTASWCRPCRAFTPRLIEAFTTQKDIALLTVCLDQTPAAQQNYTEKMPWPTLDFYNPNRERLLKEYHVLEKGIPRILIFSQDGQGPISENGTDFVDNPNAIPYWIKQIQENPKKSN